MAEGDPDAHLRWMSFRKDISGILAMEARVSRDPWDESDFWRWLRARTCVGVVADVDGKIGGYFIYKIENNCVFIPKLIVAPEYRYLELERQMVDRLISVLQTYRISRLILALKREDREKLRLFENCGFTLMVEKPDDADGNQAHYIMRYQLPAPKLKDRIEDNESKARETEETAASSGDQRDALVLNARRFMSMPLAEVLRSARRKLTELTYVEWEVMKLDGEGQLIKSEIPAHLDSSSGYYFRTYAKVLDPNLAMESLRAFFGKKVVQESIVTPSAAAGRVVIPAELISEAHLRLGGPGELSNVFKVVEKWSRYKGLDGTGPGEGTTSPGR